MKFKKDLFDGEEFSITIPNSVANKQLPDPDLLEYYINAENRIYFIDGAIDDSSLEYVKVIMKCNAEDKGLESEERKPIRFFIDSNGGDVQAMWTLVNAIKISKTPVYTICYCTAMSAAAHILAAGHKRFALRGSTILVHSGSTAYQGTVEQVESAKRYFDNLGKKVDAMLIADTKINAKDLKKRGASDWFMSDEEALQYGLIDTIVSDFSEVL